mgnify:CR=1 FL=1
MKYVDCIRDNLPLKCVLDFSMIIIPLKTTKTGYLYLDIMFITQCVLFNLTYGVITSFAKLK